MNFRMLAVTALSMVAMAGAGSAQTPPPTQTPPTQTPIPRPAPFPGGSAPPIAPKPAETLAQPAGGALDLGSVDPKLAGVQGYPGAEFLASYDAGKNQRMFAFGTNDPYASVIAFYKNHFRKAGEEVSKTPGIVQFELGVFDPNTMAQRPSVIVKDYSWPDPAGYLHVAGTTSKHFKTIVQIIPAGK